MMSSSSQILFWVINLFLLELINFIVIFPIIFHVFIIPRIQRRLCGKLKYTSPFYNMQVFSRWFYPVVDLSTTIVFQYLSWKCTGRLSKSDYKSKNPYNPFVLATNDYDVRQVPAFEVIMAFIVFINALIFLVVIAISFLYSYFKWS